MIEKQLVEMLESRWGLKRFTSVGEGLRSEPARGGAARGGARGQQAHGGGGLPEGLLPARAGAAARAGEGHGARRGACAADAAPERRGRDNGPGRTMPGPATREMRHGQDHRDRPRDHQLLRGHHGRRPAGRHPELGGPAHHAVHRRLHRQGRSAWSASRPRTR